MGELGQSTIQSVLSHTEHPGNAIKEIQIKASLRNPRCRPLLSLLDELGVTRCPLLLRNTINFIVMSFLGQIVLYQKSSGLPGYHLCLKLTREKEYL